ncbi:MAG: response regulator [Candidatus Omnitrophica bacterium]|nr:response regulator [Candidatus Omnitrophota bacterium]
MEEKSLEQKNRILIVDDDKSVRDFLEMFLKKKGYINICSVDSGAEALKAVETQDIKLVLLDIKLGAMDGLDILRKIKEKKPGMGVIMITGYPDEAKAKEAINNGAYDYIVKPFDLTYLELSVLTKILLMS